MNMKKKLVIAATVATIGAGGLGVGLASAETNNKSTSNSMAEKIATKFGLKKADVQAVFDEEHAARKAERAQKVADKLAAAVKAGTITQAQSDAITAKVKELQAKHEATHDKMADMTAEERKAAMESERSAMKQWVTDNNIPDEFARLLRMGGRGHGGPGMMHRSASNSERN